MIVSSDEFTGFKAHAHQIEKAITPKLKILLLNSPNNPTGQMYTRKEIDDIAALLKRHPKIIVISDDIYSQIVFNGESVAPHLLHSAPELKSRMILINGASKTYSMTGWRLGWALGPEAVIKAMSNYQSQTVSCAAPFTQTATLAGLQQNREEILGHVKILQARRDQFVDGLNTVPGWRSGYPQGAFYVWADVRGILGKKWQGSELKTCTDVAKALLEAQYVAVVPGGESGSWWLLAIELRRTRARPNRGR